MDSSPARLAAASGQTGLPSRSDWAAGWPLVVAAFFGLAAASAPAASLGIMLKPLTTAYGWSRTEFSFGYSIVAIVMLLCSGPVGAAIDRFGTRRVVIPALVALNLGFAGLAFTGPSLIAWYASMAVIGVGLSAAGPLGWAPAVASRFERSRAFALGLAFTGSGFAAAVVPMLGSILIGMGGTQTAFLTLAGLAFGVSVPLAFLFLRDARDVQRERGHSGLTVRALAGQSVRQGITSLRYWRLCASMVAIVASTSILNFHLVAHVVEHGAAPTSAALALSLIGPASIFGRLATGLLLDKFTVPLVAGTAFMLAGLGNVLIALYPDQLGLVMLGMCLAGIAAGAEADIAAFAVSRYFGLRAFGALYGIMFGLIGLTFGIAPTIAAYTRDHLGSYELVFLVLATLAAFAALLVATLGRYPNIACSTSDDE